MEELEDLRMAWGKWLSSRNEVFISFYSGIWILKSEPLDSDGESIFHCPSFFCGVIENAEKWSCKFVMFQILLNSTQKDHQTGQVY